MEDSAIKKCLESINDPIVKKELKATTGNALEHGVPYIMNTIDSYQEPLTIKLFV